jgi:hypothetical protein
MTITRNAAFPHRRNYDGSFDSICRTCFATVGHAKNEARLTKHEKNHSCAQAILAGRGVPNPIVSMSGLYLVPRAMPTDAAYSEPIASLAVGQHGD